MSWIVREKALIEFENGRTITISKGEEIVIYKLTKHSVSGKIKNIKV